MKTETYRQRGERRVERNGALQRKKMPRGVCSIGGLKPYLGETEVAGELEKILAAT